MRLCCRYECSQSLTQRFSKRPTKSSDCWPQEGQPHLRIQNHQWAFWECKYDVHRNGVMIRILNSKVYLHPHTSWYIRTSLCILSNFWLLDFSHRATVASRCQIDTTHPITTVFTMVTTGWKAHLGSKTVCNLQFSLGVQN